MDALSHEATHFLLSCFVYICFFCCFYYRYEYDCNLQSIPKQITEFLILVWVLNINQNRLSFMVLDAQKISLLHTEA